MSRIIFGLLLSVCFLLSACSSTPVMKVGVTAGPNSEILTAVKAVASQEGLTVQTVTYGDYLEANQALERGDILANCIQNQQYLDQINAQHYRPLVSAAQTYLLPMALYSQKITSLQQLLPQAVVAIPADPVNCARALLLLEKNNLITLRSEAGSQPSLDDISQNPKNLRFQPYEILSAAASALPQADLTALPATAALRSGLAPLTQSLAHEDITSPYTFVIAVRSQDKDNPLVQTLVRAYHSDAVRQRLQAVFPGAAIAAW